MTGHLPDEEPKPRKCRRSLKVTEGQLQKQAVWLRAMPLKSTLCWDEQGEGSQAGRGAVQGAARPSDGLSPANKPQRNDSPGGVTAASRKTSLENLVEKSGPASRGSAKSGAAPGLHIRTTLHLARMVGWAIVGVGMGGDPDLEAAVETGRRRWPLG